MDDFQKIIAQMLKVQMDHQQKSDERQQRMEEQRVQQQKQQQQQQQQQRNEERLLQALMKSEEWQNQMEELLLRSLIGTKTSENDTTFSQGTIYSTIETFEYVPENDKTFDEFYRRYEDIFNVDCKEWSNEKKARLLLRKLGTTEHRRFVNLILNKKNNTTINGSGVLRDS